MAGFLDFLESLDSFIQGSPRRETRGGAGRRVPSPPSSSRQGDVNFILIRRNTRSFHVERGWHRKGRRLVGFYRTKHGSYEGHIENPDSRHPSYFITNPPREVLSGTHGPCFSECRRGVFSIHFSPKPRSVDSGIKSVETTITESFR